MAWFGIKTITEGGGAQDRQERMDAWGCHALAWCCKVGMTSKGGAGYAKAYEEKDA
jgi:hypothetical protein